MVEQTKLTPILAIETSSVNCSAAIFVSVDEIYSVNLLKKNIHSQKILSAVDSLLAVSGLELNDIGSIAISNGPGSFTGLRIGLAAAKGIAFGAGFPLIAVNTVDALSLKIVGLLPEDSVFNVFIHVNRDEVYFAKFKNVSGKSEKIDKLKIVKATEIGGLINSKEFNYSDKKFTELNSNIILPDAEYVAKWSYIYALNLATYDYDLLEPDYVKQFYPRVKL